MLTKYLETMFKKGEEKCVDGFIEGKPVRTSIMTMALGILEGLADIFLITGFIAVVAGFFVKEKVAEE